MKRLLVLLTLVSAFSPLRGEAPATAPASSRERISLNADWRFTKGDTAWIVFDNETAQRWTLSTSAPLLGPMRTKPARPDGDLGSEINHVQPGFDDSAWRKLDLPHDWGIEGAFQLDLPGESGKLPWHGIGWYRKRFTAPASDAGRHVSLQVDGAMSFPVIWLNGHFVGGWAYGYTSFEVDLTPYLKPGDDNVLVVRLNNPADSSRWYPGGGIYRNVWLLKTDPIHVAQWGAVVTTPQVSAESAAVNVTALIENESAHATDVSVRTELFLANTEGRPIGPAVAASSPTSKRAPRGRQLSVSHELKVDAPRLWSIKQPQRYVAVTTVEHDGKLVDRYETPFGIRRAEFDAARGFLLNGEVVRIQGVNLHHDLGALGAAINSRAIERRLEILRSMGCNAIRTSHNPPAPEFLDACDRLGFVVIVEAFDSWAAGKKTEGYHRIFADWHEQDLRALIRRDRNHPSVILWSIGNEVIEQWGDAGIEGWKLARHLAGIAREEDRTRGITAGFNNGDAGANGYQTVLDVVGFNYQIRTYGPMRASFPNVPFVGSETASTQSSRGEYFFPFSDNKLDPIMLTNFQVSSYDYTTNQWCTTPEEEFRAADAALGYAGEFVWTGFDYLGEPAPYFDDPTQMINFTDPAVKAEKAKEFAELGRLRAPSRSAYFGIVDLAGLPKDRFYLYQARWRPDHPMAHILPHWTWPEREGEVTPIHVYTSGDEAELFLNGRSLGRKKRGPDAYRLRWDDVRYTPGEVKVIAYKNGQRWAEDVQRTARAPAKIALTPDRATLRADGKDLVYVTVDLTDAAGVLAPRADNLVRFSLQGPGEIVATDNGNPISFESFQAPQRKVFNGRAVVIVRSRAGQAGALVLRAESDGLAPADVAIAAQ